MIVDPLGKMKGAGLISPRPTAVVVLEEERVRAPLWLWLWLLLWLLWLLLWLLLCTMVHGPLRPVLGGHMQGMQGWSSGRGKREWSQMNV